MSNTKDTNGNINVVELFENLKGTKFNLPTLNEISKISEKINGVLKSGNVGRSIGKSIYSVIFQLKISVDGILEGVQTELKIDNDFLKRKSQQKVEEKLVRLDQKDYKGEQIEIGISEDDKELIKLEKVQLPTVIEGSHEFTTIGNMTSINIGNQKIWINEPNL